MKFLICDREFWKFERLCVNLNLKTFIIAGVLIISSMGNAAQTCFEQMQARKKEFQHLLVYQNNFYKVEKLLPGKHGGKKVVLRRWEFDSEWAIVRTEEHGTAPPGNPLRFLLAMPKPIADFFSFEMLDKDFKPVLITETTDPKYLVIPDVFEINGALKKLDKMLIKLGYFGIPFRFFLDDGVTSSEAFLQNLNSAAVPFSTDSLISYHDLNYHLIPMLILNEKMIQLSKLHSNVFLKFAEWLRKNHPNIATDSVISSVLEIRAHHIDNTGNLSLLMASPNFSGHSGVSLRATKGFIGWGKSPYDYLAKTIEATWSDSTHLTLRALNAEMLKEFEKTLSPEFLTPDPATPSLAGDIETIQAQFQQRIQEILQALAGIPNPAKRP